MTELSKDQYKSFEKVWKSVDELCDSYEECHDCPFFDCKSCPYEDVHSVLPVQEILPIDLDDDYHCDECCHPISNGCGLKDESDCPYGLGECCDDNLATNVGRICFDHNLPTNFAMAIIEIIQKERDRNEYLHIYREHIPAE